MLTVRYGGKKGKKVSLAVSDDFVAVRTRGGEELAPERLSKGARGVVDQVERVVRFPLSGVEVVRVKVRRKRRAVRDKVRKLLKKEKVIRFAGRVLCDRLSKRPVLYTENLFVKFDKDRSTRSCRKVLREHGLKVKRELEYARNAFFVGAPEGCGHEIFPAAERLLAEATVELCHPELVREVRRLEAFAPQWHLHKTKVDRRVVDEHAHVAEAWQESRGEGIVIAVIDDGVDLDHEEFASRDKIVAPRDASRRTSNPRPGQGDNHGTACAGVACADGVHGASGVAPAARLMPIRLVSGLGSQAEADAFVWAAENGADVISCSWGPEDGEWWNPDDPRHKAVVPLPDSTRLAIDFAIRNGRGGKGCVVTWAAGNGNESVDNDGYAKYEKVIAVAACNDEGAKSLYSDFGKAIWCAFPSSDFRDSSRTPGIWTTDRSGNTGYNPGQEAKGDAAGNYTNSFGGTSSSCPGAAGVAALVLARNPALRWDEVKDVLRRSCDRIDSAGGRYDAEGHSTKYGYGRLNAARAVKLAAPVVEEAARGYVATHSGAQRVPIKDLKTASLGVEVGDTSKIRSLKVRVELEHTYIGDLVVRVVPPSATGVGAVVLHNRAGDSTRDLAKTWDAAATPALATLIGKVPQGTWTLEVEDKAKRDEGQILAFAVELGL